MTDIDGLTGLAEYRNGGLFVDTGVLAFRDPARRDAPARRRLAAGGRMARADRGPARPPGARWCASGSGCDAASLPLARMLRRRHLGRRPRLARELRPDGAPPIAVVSDGTVF